MNDKAQSRLYFVTAIACFVWLVQSVQSAIADGMLWHWSNIIFVLCIATVVTYCVYQGIVFNKKARLAQEAEEFEESEDAEDVEAEDKETEQPEVDNVVETTTTNTAQ